MQKILFRIILLFFGLSLIYDNCEARHVDGYIVTGNSDTLYGEIKVQKFNTLTGGYSFSGINLELFHIEVSFKVHGGRGFKTYLPEDISGFGFQYELTELFFRSFILESKSITRNDRKRYRFLSLEYDGEISLYSDLVRMNSTSDMNRGTSYVNTYYYLFSDLIGLKKVEIGDNIKSLTDLLAIYGFEQEFLDGLPDDTNPKDIKAILKAYDDWFIHRETLTPAIESFEFPEYDIGQIRQDYDAGKYTVTGLVQAYLQRIEQLDQHGPGLHSIIQVNPDALMIAEALDLELKAGKKRGPLHGIPVVLKDNIDTHDKMPTTGGSRALLHSLPLQDSYLAKKLREAGAVIIAKANLSEWANFRGELSTSGWSGAGGQTKNPYDLSRNPCGSSSGSAVAVAANLTVLAIGTETNGSIVCPSHSNGIVGIKPTVGLVSRSGVIPISFTQDTPGPMARSVKDAAICLGVLAGMDSADAKTLDNQPVFFTDYTQFLKADGLKGKRIGLFKAPLGINFKVDSLMYRAVDFMKNQGAEIIEINEILDPKVEYHSLEVMLFEYKDGLNAYFRSLGQDAPVKNIGELIAFNLSDSVELRFFNQKYLELAQEKGDLTSKAYLEALEEMLTGSREKGIDRVMDSAKLDAIIAPTGSPAWMTDLINGDSFQLGSSSPAAIAGYPSITVPMGFIDGLPVGISIFGRAWSEPLLLEIAYAYETGTRHRKAPTFNGSR